MREALINGQAIARRAARSLRWRAAFLSYTTCVMDGAVAKGPPRNKQIEFDVEALAQQGAFSTTYSSYFEKTERR